VTNTGLPVFRKNSELLRGGGVDQDRRIGFCPGRTGGKLLNRNPNSRKAPISSEKQQTQKEKKGNVS